MINLVLVTKKLSSHLEESLKFFYLYQKIKQFFILF